MDLRAIGGLFGLPFKEVYDYLKGVKETLEVHRQLGSVLQSIDFYKASSKACEDSGAALLTEFDSLKSPISSQDAKALVRASIENTKELSNLLSSICMFGKECNDLISGDFEAFMLKVKMRKPIAHDFLTFFGRNYNPKTGVLDLTRLPTLLRIYGPKIGWKESKEMAKEVEDAREVVTRTIEKARELVKHGPLPRVTERRLIKDYVQAVRKLAREMKNLQSNKTVDRELRHNSPSWFVDLMEIGEEVQKALPELSRSSVLTYRRLQRLS